MRPVHDDFGRFGLYRPRYDRVIAGVCSGVARRFRITALTARALFVVALFVLPGSPLLMYPVLWLLMPSE